MSNIQVDPKTGKVTFPKAEPKEKGKPTPSTDAYVAVPKTTMAKLAKLATRNGFHPDAESEKGKVNQTSKACKTLILVAIDRYLAEQGA